MIKNITLSLEESLIEQARDKARQEHKSLNQVFRGWVARYVGRQGSADGYRSLMKQLGGARAGKKFSREELNER